jgi:hypothetical protein
MAQAHFLGGPPPDPTAPPQIQVVQISAQQCEKLIELLTPGYELAKRYLHDAVIGQTKANVDVPPPPSPGLVEVGGIVGPIGSPVPDGSDVVETADGGVLGG